jgi:RNA polymerase sigma-70 factor (ECF subfamily)
LKKNINISQESLGDRNFFEKVFREYFVPLTYYAHKFVRDGDTAKDIVHAVFISIWEKAESIQLDRPLKSYLYTAVHNRCLNHIRDHSRFHAEDAGDVDYINELSASDHDRIEEQETESRILEAINKLPERCAEIFRLSRFEELKYSEIAERLGISVKTVENQMIKALKILREELKDLLILLLLWIITHI